MFREKRYKFGNTVFAVKSSVDMLFDPKIEEFACDDEPDYTYNIVFGDCEHGSSYIPCVRNGNCIDADVNGIDLEKIKLPGFLCGVNAAHLLPEKGAFILHASNITVDGEAILFTAPSGTGKSTQAHYWRDERGAELVNEDRAIVFPKDGMYYAAGCWAMGSGDVCRNVTAPIRAIVVLSQGKENVVAKPSSAELLSKIVPQCSFDDKSITGRIQIIEAVSKMIDKVNIVSFACRNEKESVSELEKFI